MKRKKIVFIPIFINEKKKRVQCYFSSDTTNKISIYSILLLIFNKKNFPKNNRLFLLKYLFICNKSCSSII